jgi:hypothetical protein
MSSVKFATIAAVTIAMAAGGPTARAAVQPAGEAVRAGSVAPGGPIFAQRARSECIGGYRTTHVVRGQGRSSAGVLIRCRG